MSDVSESAQAQIQYESAIAYLDANKRNAWRAVSCLRKAIKLNPEHLDAILLLIKCYRRGKVLRPNEGKVAALHLKAAQLGDVRAQSETGVNYYSGCWLNRDYREAVKWFQLAAERGDLDAQGNLGIAYDHGNGVTRDHVKAVECYREAARFDHVPSLYHLGTAYEQGRGVSGDLAVARVLYERAFDEAQLGFYDDYVGRITEAKERSNGRFIYFAYGSNMFTPRLQHRVSSACIIGWGFTEEYRLAFDKVSSDGSGKATIERREEQAGRGENDNIDEWFRQEIERPREVWGVVYSISNRDADALDRVEGVGHGYEKISIHLDHYLNETMSLASSSSIDAITYHATKRDKSALPYDWYKDYVVAGAKQHELPQNYIAFIGNVPFARDPNAERREREEKFLSAHLSK